MNVSFRILTAALLILSACADGNEVADEPLETAPDAMDERTGIVGSYRLVGRELPDGSITEPPDIFGFMTYTEAYRHFHIYHSPTDATPTSESFVTAYSMSADEYSEESLYEVVNNRTEGAGLEYSIPGTAFATPVSRTGERIAFRDGQSGPTLVFSGDSMVATLDGVFVDRWIRVE